MMEATLVLRAGVWTGFWLIAAALYRLPPSIIAGLRGHHQLGPIVVINVLLGWTFLGRVAAIAWSVSHLPGRTP